MTYAETDSKGNVVNYVTRFDEHLVCNNTLSYEITDCEKSEQADAEFEKFARLIEAMPSPSAKDFEKLRSLFRKASQLAFKAGIEHQKCGHTCLAEFDF